MLVSKARYEGYSEESPVIRWFWEIVEGFSQELMNTFIQFVTGSPKITVFNSNFNITIEKVYDVNCLPVAHTWYASPHAASTPSTCPSTPPRNSSRRNSSPPSARATTASAYSDIPLTAYILLSPINAYILISLYILLSKAR